MSKGLEALKNIKNNLKDSDNYINLFDTLDLSIIEKELKRLEEIDNGAYVSIHINRYNELCDKEEVLEIIKNKITFDEGYEVFLTKKEYDLLKEVLKNE